MSYTQPTIEEKLNRRAALAPFDAWNERAFSAIVAWFGLPSSYLDLGSGTGAMVNFARKMGINAYGVDLINGPEHWFIHHDLTQPLQLMNEEGDFQQVDVMTCFEVAEHIEERYAGVLCDTIARHMTEGGVLVFSSAPPGQAGEHHVNCQPSYYWRSLLKERGVSYREDFTRELSHLLSLSYVTGPMMWLSGNLQVFDR